MSVVAARLKGAGVALACAACCAVPMLVIAGVVSIGALAAGVPSLLAAVAVVILAVRVAQGRGPAMPNGAAVAATAGGVVLAGLGLASARRGDDGQAVALVVIGVGLLACVALVRLANAVQVQSKAEALESLS